MYVYTHVHVCLPLIPYYWQIDNWFCSVSVRICINFLICHKTLKRANYFPPNLARFFFFIIWIKWCPLERNTQREFLDPPRKFFLLIYAEPEIPITLAQGNLRGHSKYHRKSKTAIKNSKTEGNFFKTRHDDNALSSMECKI